MNVKNKKILLIISIILILMIICIILIINSNRNSTQENMEENIYQSKQINEIIEENNVSEEEKNEINILKQDIGITGNTDLYEIQKDNYNTKVIAIKPSIKYKIAFSGMIKGKKPEISEVDGIINKNHPRYAGIWIESNSKSKFMELLNSYTKSQYEIDETGYLRLKNKTSQNDNDKIIENIINGNKLYIISMSNTCYIIDDVTGEILDYCFEELDRYQTYEYFEDEDKMIIFVTENKYNLLDNKNIFDSILKLMSK